MVAALVASSQPLLTQVVFAHANLSRAEPSLNSTLEDSPRAVLIWFTEPLEPEFSEIQILDAQGQRVDNRDSFVDDKVPNAMSVTLSPLPNGTYTVAWKNVSTVDGHRVRGSFLFSVGEPITGAVLSEISEQPLLQSPAEPVLRWLVLLSILAAVGGLGFELLVSRPVLARMGHSEKLQQLGERLASRTLRLVWVALGVFLVASVGHLLVQTAVIQDIPVHRTLGSPLASVLTRTDWGRLWLWRIGVLLATAAVLGLASIVSSGRQQRGITRSDTIVRAVTTVFAAGGLLTLSWVSHGAATTEIRAAAIFSDYLHLVAVGFWVGGLFYFAMAIPLVMRTLSSAERRTVLSAMVPRFSTVATLSVGTLIITGLYNTWAQVTVVPALVTPYGLTLIAKLGLVVPLLLLGALNLLWVRPRLAREGEAGRWLRRFVTGEAILAVLVLVSVGMLTSLEPARQVASRQGIGQEQGFTFQDTAEGADIILDVEPGQVGPNRVLVTLKDRFGDPITNASDVSVRLTYLNADLGEPSVSATDTGDGQYVIEDALIGITGPWQVELVVRRPDAFDARTAFRFDVAGGASGSAEIAPASNTGKLLWGVELALLGLLLLATGIPLVGWRTRAGAAVMGPGVASALVGLFLIVNTQLTGAGTQEILRNPFPPNSESLQVGLQVFEQNCMLCHGASGRGDGPLAAGLIPRPADLVVHVPLHPEGDLFGFVHDGIPGTAMAPLGGKLTDEQIWHVINYIKTFVE